MWIAFKLLYLWHHRQPARAEVEVNLRCELLSNYCIFDITDNLFTLPAKRKLVVNCFQIIVSLTSQTTPKIKTLLSQMLWIAFKLLYLWHHRQLLTPTEIAVWSCELLSNYCIFDITDNSGQFVSMSSSVVNCFQIIVSLTSQTTRKLCIVRIV